MNEFPLGTMSMFRQSEVPAWYMRRREVRETSRVRIGNHARISEAMPSTHHPVTVELVATRDCTDPS